MSKQEVTTREHDRKFDQLIDRIQYIEQSQQKVIADIGALKTGYGRQAGEFETLREAAKEASAANSAAIEARIEFVEKVIGESMSNPCISASKAMPAFKRRPMVERVSDVEALVGELKQ